MTLKEQCDNYKGEHRKMTKKIFDKMQNELYEDIFNHLTSVTIINRVIDTEYEFSVIFENQGSVYGYNCIAEEKTLIKLRDMLNKKFN